MSSPLLSPRLWILALVLSGITVSVSAKQSKPKSAARPTPAPSQIFPRPQQTAASFEESPHVAPRPVKPSKAEPTPEPTEQAPVMAPTPTSPSSPVRVAPTVVPPSKQPSPVASVMMQPAIPPKPILAPRPIRPPGELQQSKSRHPNNWFKPVAGELTNPFGNGYWYFGIYRGGHTGVDIKAAVGTPVVASAAGKVVFLQPRHNMRYGYYVVLEHANGYYSLYGHLNRFSVKLNQKVEAGQTIGTVGASGAAGYAHLHFEILNQRPIYDGAWGYSYICKQRPTPEGLNIYNFVNQPAKELGTIMRLRDSRCNMVKLKQSLVYYNPEDFYQDPARKIWAAETQPANEEKKWQRKGTEALSKKP